MDEYLSHNIRSVYQLETEDDIGSLVHELEKGTIFSFPYSYRGGLDADAGFLLMGSDRVSIEQPLTLYYAVRQSSQDRVNESGFDVADCGNW